MNTAAPIPTAVALPSARPAVRVATSRRSFVQVLRHQASLLTTLTLLGSSAAYCVYTLGSIIK